MASLEVLLGVVAAVVLLGVVAVRLSVRVGLPSLLLYLGMGVLLGESVLGFEFSDAQLTESLGLAALVLILAEGGLTTRWTAVRPALGVGIALSTAAVAVSIGVVGVGLHYLLDLEWRTAFLWGAVLSSTDAAAVFSVLRGVGVGPRLSGALELESGMNDAPVVLAVILLASGDPFTWLTPLQVVYELGAGGIIGGLFGLGGAWALRRAALPSTGLYPLAAIAVCVLAYSTGQLAHASGLLATYVAALVLGNSNLPHRARRAVVRRGPRLARPDRPVRAARALRLPAAARRRGGARPDRRGGAAAGRAAAVGDRGGDAVPMVVAGAGVPVLVRAARCGAHRPGADRPDRGRSGRAGAGRRGVRARRRADPAPGDHPAVGGPDPGGRPQRRAAARSRSTPPRSTSWAPTCSRSACRSGPGSAGSTCGSCGCRRARP